MKDLGRNRQRLLELAEVLNAFKSEAVQLRVMEMVLGDAGPDAGSDTPPRTPRKAAPGRRPRKAPRAAAPVAAAVEKAPAGKKPARKPSASRALKEAVPAAGGPARARKSSLEHPGGKAMLDNLMAEGFFSRPRSLAEIVAHCAETRHLEYGLSDFSGPLSRLVKTGQMSRRKNKAGRFQYTKP